MPDESLREAPPLAKSARSGRSKRAGAAAAKPRADFPLFRHRNNQWAKKVRGKLHYFGTDTEAALAKWLDERDDLLAGRKPRRGHEELTVSALCNQFLTTKRGAIATGELSKRTWADYYRVCETIVSAFGGCRVVSDLRADDFAALRLRLAKRNGPVGLSNEVQRVRTVFNFAWNNELIDRPVRWGDSFRKPSRKALRVERQRRGSRMIDADELKTILEAVRRPMKAMILLGLNCAFGQSDIAALPLDALNLDAGWVDFPRQKTAVPRRCPLWPETVAALRDAIEGRPTPRDQADVGLVFITKYGRRFIRTRDREDKGAIVVDGISQEFRKLLRRLNLKRTGNFYNLRRVFRTVAAEAKDPPAVDLIMGHAEEAADMGERYVQRIGDDRLNAVVNVVRTWLWPGPATPATIPFEVAAAG
jgi:integrase